MPAVITKERRSQLMARIRSKDTVPELRVRRLIHSLGYRYRLHSKDLPGKPDIVFSRKRKLIFVHGCFWHCCKKAGCRKAHQSRSNEGYWGPKIESNVERDRKCIRSLRRIGWKVLVIWECETADEERLAIRITKFLGPIRS
jgi:DNA mismatch endonuclease (patch repair protein)